MTGEITLRGRVLPIGGLKEKILAAHRGLVNKVLIPEENKKDIEEIPKRILKKVELVLVAHMDDVLRKALVLKEGEELFAPHGRVRALLRRGDAGTEASCLGRTDRTLKSP